MHDQGLYKKFRNLVFHSKPIPHFTFSTLTKFHHALAHAVFTRRGGSSSGPFSSLNVGFNLGDDSTSVRLNIARVTDALGARHLVSMNQVHGSKVVSLHCGDIVKDMILSDCDAIVTDAAGVAIMVKLADCQGVILFSPAREVVGIVHCGWRGNVSNILAKTVKIMKEEFNCDPREIVAAISPSLGPCCGEFTGYGKIFPADFSHFMVRKNYFDLWAISRRQLMDAGVREENIDTAGVCTRCNADLFFSYRRNKVTGRFAVVAMLLT